MMATSLGFPNGLATEHMSPHLILVGISGAGKTTIGTMVAQRLGRTFMDLDREIERREQATVSEIFAEKGEPYFREKERELTEELTFVGNMIVSPGGGWAMDPEVVGLVRPPSKLVYLKVRPVTALKRLGPMRSLRPLLMRPNPQDELERLLKARKDAYESADFVVDTELLSAQLVIDKVIELASTK